jgi:phosphatidylinositol alpha-1,6-mannosyltransferase
VIVGLFSGMLDTGGIERASRQVGALLQKIACDLHQSCLLLSLNDPPGWHELTVGNLSFAVRGFGRRKSRFVRSVLAAARRSRLLYAAHTNLAPLGLLVKWISPNQSLCVATHGAEVWQPLSMVRKWALRNADRVTAPSRFTADKVIAVQNVPAEKMAVVPWAVDPRFLEKKPSGVTSAIPVGKILLTVSRLAAPERQKGIDTVIRALPKLLEVFSDCYYVIVGDGDDRSRLMRLAESTGVKNRIVFAGFKSDEELVPYYEACDVFVMPSCQEGFGVVFLEAMAFGKPVIGGNHGGTPEVVIDGVTGFLVNYDDEEALAKQFLCLLRSAELRQQMGRAGRRRVEEYYSLNHLQAYFENWISSHAGSGGSQRKASSGIALPHAPNGKVLESKWRS